MAFFVIGAGIWGCVMAERIANVLHEPVTVLEKRSHIGGNCHSFIDADTGIECHAYGSHIFHTSLKNVYDYITGFMTLTSYRHKVLTRHDGHVYPMPINLATINQMYGLDLSPQAAREFMAAEIARDAVPNPANLEEKAISLIGRPLYEAFIKNYTAKQWDRPPAQLPQSIINRLPVRLDYNFDYFNDAWQGVPLAGYHELFKTLLANPRIQVRTNCDYNEIRSQLPSDATIIYTGLPDRLFDYKFGELDWRSLRFEWETLPVHDFQGTTVMNYADADVPFTRIHEFKHYHPERQAVFASDRTIICREYPASFTRDGEACYPVNDERNNDLYQRYAAEAAKTPGLILGGRLGAYKYWDMDRAINDALETFAQKIQ